MFQSNISCLARISVSDAMRLFGLTARALRFYEEKGLIEARRDRLNHRYYDTVARRRLAWIAPLRAAGLSLADIEEVLVAEEDGRDALRAATERLERRRAALAVDLAAMDAAIVELTGRPAPALAAAAGVGRR